MVTDWDCFSIGKKGEVPRSFSGRIPTFANVDLMVLAKEEFEAEKQVALSQTLLPPENNKVKHVQEI